MLTSEKERETERERERGRERETLCKTILIQLLMGSERNNDLITMTQVCRRYNS